MSSRQCAIFWFLILTSEQNRLLYFTPVARIVPWTSYSIVVRLVGNQIVGRLNVNVFATAAELGH